MGLFNSLYIKCPDCGNELEFQSKSGECAMSVYNDSNLSPTVAVGMDDDIVRCDFCNNNFELNCDIPETVKVQLIKTKRKEFYKGNYDKNRTLLS